MLRYRNTKTVVNGITFDSKKESKYYIYLKSLLANGTIQNLELQPRFELQEGFRGPDGAWIRPITYVADFKYTVPGTGETVVVDVKSRITEQDAVYRMKRKMFIYKYPTLKFVEIVK